MPATPEQKAALLKLCDKGLTILPKAKKNTTLSLLWKWSLNGVDIDVKISPQLVVDYLNFKRAGFKMAL